MEMEITRPPMSEAQFNRIYSHQSLRGQKPRREGRELDKAEERMREERLYERSFSEVEEERITRQEVRLKEAMR